MTAAAGALESPQRSGTAWSGGGKGLDYRIISIGTLAAHPLWGERGAVRTAHATTTLVRSGDRAILVDPSLPGEILDARLRERCGFGCERITHVFLTLFRPDLRRGLRSLDHATWWLSEAEREAVGATLVAAFGQARDEGEADHAGMLREEIALLRRCEPAPDKLAPQVDLFPLPGYTPGLAGLLLAAPRCTVLICGDAIPTMEHLEQGQVLADCYSLDQARESFGEAIEIADLLILGRDDLAVNPMRRPF